jgi:hypothetical protein
MISIYYYLYIGMKVRTFNWLNLTLSAWYI